MIISYINYFFCRTFSLFLFWSSFKFLFYIGLSLIYKILLVSGVQLSDSGIHIRMHAKWLQLYLTLCNPMDCSPPGSFVHGIFPARLLQWVAIPSSRESSWLEKNLCLLQLLHYCWVTGEAHRYIYPFFFRFFSHIGHYRILSTIPWALQ